METLDRAESLISAMTAAEKAQVLQWLARDLAGGSSGVEHEAGVAGGEACLVRTRIPVWVLVQARTLGASEADLLRMYPALRAEDLVNAWAYHRVHRDEIERHIAENEAA